jgi:hypothetical protein
MKPTWWESYKVQRQINALRFQFHAKFLDYSKRFRRIRSDINTGNMEMAAQHSVDLLRDCQKSYEHFSQIWEYEDVAILFIRVHGALYEVLARLNQPVSGVALLVRT